MGAEPHEAAGGHAAMISRIRSAKFRTVRFRPGYDDREVDEFLDRLIAALSGQGPLDPALVRDRSFSLTRWRPGYVQADVQALLDDVQRFAEGHR